MTTNDIDTELDIINWVRAVRETVRPEGMPERQWVVVRLALIWTFGVNGYVSGPGAVFIGPTPGGPVRLDQEKARDVLRWAVALGLVERTTTGGPDGPPGYRVVPRVGGDDGAPGAPTLA